MANDIDSKLPGELRVLSALAQAGLTGRRNGDLADELGLQRSTMTGILRRLVQSGWAQASGDGFVVGPMVETAIRRINEDKAVTAEKLSKMMAGAEPAPAGPDGGEQLLGLRMMTELLKSNKNIEKKLDELVREREALGGKSKKGIA